MRGRDLAGNAHADSDHRTTIRTATNGGTGPLPAPHVLRVANGHEQEASDVGSLLVTDLFLDNVPASVRVQTASELV